MRTALLIVHGLVAVALLGAISHQALATWAPSRARPNSFFGRLRAVPSASYANAIVVLYAVTALLGGLVYLYFRIDIRPDLERAGEWPALGLFDIKEHFIAIGLALLPAYWMSWRRPRAGDPVRTRVALTSILTIIVWWAFLIGHVLNDIRGFGA
jgi:amino acid permease